MQTKTAAEIMQGLEVPLREKMLQNSPGSEMLSRCRFCSKVVDFDDSYDRLHCVDCCHGRVDSGIAYRLGNVSKILEKIGVPPKFVGTGFPFPDRLLRYISGNNERGFFLTGASGVGKTTWLSLFVERWMTECAKRNADFPAWRFENGVGLMMQIQRAFKRDNEDAYILMDKVAEIPFLAIDDIGATKSTDFVRQAMYYIINEREAHERPTFITSNFSLTELNDQLDPRISSRIAGMCDVIEMRGNDRRISG